ncbi:hypothetical protein Purlil1_5798 [Purpureocillium lilacinum]|uniref:Uncharacterized protein n=1 Tax=Purpureocillium lilacinum TaxID=33203 RepID=A0ABR0C0H0_PURLI|nr:hypothetical protein Purlil1_5798 [Purpureocillium lilacinum]
MQGSARALSSSFFDGSQTKKEKNPSGAARPTAPERTGDRAVDDWDSAGGRRAPEGTRANEGRRPRAAASPHADRTGQATHGQTDQTSQAQGGHGGGQRDPTHARTHARTSGMAMRRGAEEPATWKALTLPDRCAFFVGRDEREPGQT